MIQLYQGKECYCCCSCAPDAGWRVEVARGQDMIVGELDPGDRILAGSLRQDGGLIWSSVPVEVLPGIGPEVEFEKLCHVSLGGGGDAESLPTSVIVTQDHLFLTPGGKLRPVQILAPGDRLMDPSGGSRSVEFVAEVRYIGSMEQLFFSGFDGTSLNGHLLSLSDTVSADFSVQLAYSSGCLGDEFVDSSVTHSATVVSDALTAFLNDPDRWPMGVTPLATLE